MATHSPRRWLGTVGLGAAAFVACHALFVLTWERWFQPAAVETPWFLGARGSIVVTQVALGLLAAILAARARGWRERLTDAGLMAAGVMAAAGALFWLIGPRKLMVGPIELWPFVLASALLLLAPAILAGALLGGFLRGLTK